MKTNPLLFCALILGKSIPLFSWHFYGALNFGFGKKVISEKNLINCSLNISDLSRGVYVLKPKGDVENLV
ncbi:hypothetical protein [Algibacter sp. 2305UL17-15]|uniref:hypothetical protein n=1 Tax=Algibacter sp. 2305UL17-15 TaxID=3231268 RepID=UPI003459B321